MAQETPAKAEAVSLNEEEAPVSGLSEVPAEGEAAEAVPDFENIEDAMAWLEALAAKQGAEEGTLTTAPDERSETPPDWLQQETTVEAISRSEVLPQAEESETAWTAELPGESEETGRFETDAVADETQPIEVSNSLEDQAELVSPSKASQRKD